MIGISCSANLFYCFCLHLPKGDYNQGHGQAPHPHLLKSRLGGSPSRPSLGFLFPISPTSSQLNLTAAATHPISLPTTHGKLLFVPQSPLLQVALPSSSPPKRRETVGEPVKVNQLEVDAARKCQCAKRGTPWHACAGGSTCDAPRDAPSSVQAQQQPSSLRCESSPQVCIHAGSRAGPCASALAYSALPG